MVDPTLHILVVQEVFAIAAMTIFLANVANNLNYASTKLAWRLIKWRALHVCCWLIRMAFCTNANIK
jgi:hypothetical protein